MRNELRAGFFISVEGLDGAGKSTQVAALSAALRKAGHEVVSVRPNDTGLGDLVAGYILQHQTSPVDPWTEALLFNAGRVQLLRETILPALDRGATVIADRYADSTLAYQGGGRGLPLESLRELHRDACADVWPDLTIYLAVPHTVAASRQRAQQLPLDRFEVAPEDFHAAVQRTFEELVAADPERMISVDATRPAAEVSRDVEAIVRERLAPRSGGPAPAAHAAFAP